MPLSHRASPPAAPGGARLLVDGRWRPRRPAARSRAVEDRDLVGARAARPAPGTTSASSAWTCSRVISPAASACCSSPISAHCSRTSTTSVAEATSAGSSSCLPWLSAPTAAMKVPGARRRATTNARRDGVQVTQTSLSRSALAQILTASRETPRRGGRGSARPEPPGPRPARGRCRAPRRAAGEDRRDGGELDSPCAPQPTMVAVRASAAPGTSPPRRWRRRSVARSRWPSPSPPGAPPWSRRPEHHRPGWSAARSAAGCRGKLALVLAAK